MVTETETSFDFHLSSSSSSPNMAKKTREEFVKGLKFICTTEFWRMCFFWTFSLLFSYFQLLFSKPPSFPRRHVSSSALSLPICVITGASSGLGAATAHALSKEGYFVVLVGRSLHSLSKTMENIERKNKAAQLKAFQVDMSSFESISNFVDSLQQWLSDTDMHHSVQLLINNAGILATSCRQTPEGYDKMMGTNYIGAFYLTRLLLPVLRNCRVHARIVNVTSFTHRSVFDAHLNKETVGGMCFTRCKQYPLARIYELSKLCLLLFSYELHQQLDSMESSSQVSVIAADPGIVETNLMREVPSWVAQMAFLVLKVLCLLQSPEQGASSIIDAALAPLKKSGLYFFGGKSRIVNSSVLSYDNKLAKELWATSCDLVAVPSKETSASATKE